MKQATRRVLPGQWLLPPRGSDRVGIRQQVSVSARIKDIAGLYFSAMDAGLSKRDILRFIRSYRDSLWHKDFLQRVDVRARKLYEKIHGRAAITPFD